MPGSGWGAGVAAVRSCCWGGGQRSRVRATSWLKSWWGNGNFPAVLDAASDLKTTAPASPDAEQGQACKCDMTAQDTPIWLPAVRPPLGRTGWEGDAPVTDAFRGGGGRAGAGPGTGTYVQAGTRCPTPCRWDRHRRSSDRDNPPRVLPASPWMGAWAQCAQHRGLPRATAAGL